MIYYRSVTFKERIVNMFGNTFGKLFRITCCGESYSGGFRKNLNLPEELYGGLMTIVDGVPPGIKITAELIQAELDKRKPGQTPLDSPRKEKDRVYIFSGVMEDQLTTGAPVGMIIPNNDIQDVHIDQYRSYKDSIRPGHAEYGFFKKYGEHGDWVGAGRASGRETASRVAGGAVAKAILDAMGIDVIAYTIASHNIKVDHEVSYEEAKANYRKNEINCPDLAAAEKMRADVLKIKESGETCGGIVAALYGGTIENCSVDIILGGEKFTDDNLENAVVGGIAALTTSESRIINCTSSGIFYCKKYSRVGGIVGEAYGAKSGSDANATISGCINKAKVTCGNVNGYAGGIIGYLEGIINLENNSFEQGIPAKEVGYSTSEK